MERLIACYLDSCRAERRLAATTLENYRLTLLRFDRWLGERPFDEPAAREYLRELEARLAPGSVWSAWQILRLFSRWLHGRGGLPTDPLAAVRMKMPRPQPQPVISAEEMRAALAGLERLRGGRYRRALAAAVVAVLGTTGLRNAELRALRLGDVNLTTGAVVVRRGKGGKQRATRLPPLARGYLARFLAVRPAAPHDFLFGDALNGQRAMRTDGLVRLLRDVLRAAGIQRPEVTPHALRRAAATWVVQAGGSVEHARQLLGHASLQTTQRYLSLPEQAVAESVDRAALLLEGGARTRSALTLARRRGERGTGSGRRRVAGGDTASGR